MGKAISLLWPRRSPREDEGERKMMELRKRPRPPRVDPDFLSSPPPLPPRKRARKQPAAKRPREAAAAAAKRQPPRKRPRLAGLGIGCLVAGLHPATCGRLAPPRMSTRVLFRPRHAFDWYEPDLWTEVAKHLCGCDLSRLSRTCRWFRRLLADDSIWRYAFFRDHNLLAASLHTPRPLHRSWRSLYLAAFDGSHAYWFDQSDKHKHLNSWRVGAFLLDSPKVLLTGKLPLPRCLPLDADAVQLSIEVLGACVLNNVRPGVWITDLHVLRCPVCNFNSCRGTMHVLDARHSELFLEEAYRDGTLEYEDLGEHFLDKEAAATFCAVANCKHLSSPCTAYVLNTKSWKRDDLLTSKCATTYAAAINTNLQRNSGLLSRFQAMRDTTRDGQVVSIRISQVLF